ncbi:hypothetical protein KBC89_05460 [Candidatus Woesebacteria bacterium]|nr:hypothetical protein [Candidatus Woesebacteria bacterium]
MAERIVNGYLLGAVPPTEERDAILSLLERSGDYKDDRGFSLVKGIEEAHYDLKTLTLVLPNGRRGTQRCNARKAAEDGYVSRDTPFGGY